MIFNNVNAIGLFVLIVIAVAMWRSFKEINGREK